MHLSIFMLTLAMINHVQSSLPLEIKTKPILMPNGHPKEVDTYLCAAVKMNPDKEQYIVEYEPKASKDVIHHMLVYGCEVPASTEPKWNCGSMMSMHASGDADSGVDKNSIDGTHHEPEIPHVPYQCQSGRQILYAWARNAPSLKLPEGVGFTVGGKSKINYLVLQLHYANVTAFKDGKRDNSGLVIHYTETPQPKSAGVLILASGGQIPPKKFTNMEIACRIQEETEIHPFRFRTHTHTLGRHVVGYHVTNDTKGKDHWKEIGSHNPLEPQMFYPVHNHVTIRKGDRIAARCVMKSDRDVVTYVGETHNDEMCNFYMMYWQWANDKRFQQNDCGSGGPPYYYWKKDKMFSNLPDIPAM